MKLASYRDGSRDGQLMVVSRDLSTAHYAAGIATRMQQLLDDWGFLSPQIEDLYATLNGGKARHAFVFEPAKCMAPLPRAFQWIRGSARLHHAEVMGKAVGAEMPENRGTHPLLVQGGSDGFLGPTDAIVCADEASDIDFEARIAVVTGDLPAGASPEAALDGVRLLMLVNDISPRNLAADEAATGCGFFQSRPATAFGPVAVTPDELGAAWRGGRVHLDLESAWNGQRVGLCDAGADMDFHFGELIAAACKTRRMRAGSIVGGGAVSRQDGSRGMRHGDTIRIEVTGTDGTSVFGAIDQRVAKA